MSVPAGFKRLTCGFRISKLHVELPYCAGWDVDSVVSDAEASCILSKPFRYLARGAQCYAFLSQDGQYVLKLFRFDYSRRSARRVLHVFEEKTTQLFQGCKLACNQACEETGLVYLHLNLTRGKLPWLSARSPLNLPIRLPLDSCRFALQKKAHSLASVLVEARTSGMLNQRLDEIIVLLENRIRKGIGNSDPNLWRNFGFLNDRAIEIDFGHYMVRSDFLESAQARQCELERYACSLQKWLERMAPESVAYFENRLRQARI